MSVAVTHNLWAAARDLAFTFDGRSLITTQEPGMARLFSTINTTSRTKESIPITHSALKDAFLVACHKTRAVITDGPTVILFSLSTACPSFLHLVTRHSLPVTSLAFSADGVWIASGSQDCSVRLIRADQVSDMHTLQHHTFPVCSISFDPQGTYLASISDNGALAIWDLTHDRIVVASMYTGKPAPDVPKPTVAWCPTGAFLAVSSAGTEVLLIDRDRLSLISKRLINSDQPQSTVSITWSTNAEFLAAGTVDSQLIVWNVKNLDAPPIRHTLPAQPVKITWQPGCNTIGALLNSQALVFIDNLVVGNPGSPPITMQAKQAVRAGPFDTGVKRIASVQPVIPLNKATNAPAWMDDQAVKAEQSGGGSESDGNPDDDDPDHASDLDDFLVDDDASGKTRKQKRVELKHQFRRAGFAETTPLQFAFQSGTTPCILGKRYLAFNLEGLITSVEQEVRHSYQVEFHDQSRLRRPLQFSDPREFTMASLSTSIAVFLSPPSQNDQELGTPSILHARILDGPSAGNASKSIWTLALGSQTCTEQPIALAAGLNRILVATDRTLRIITIGGIVVHTWTVPSQLVTVAAADKWCMWVNHCAAPFNGDQQLAWTLYDMMDLTVVRTGHLALSSGSQLQWLAFSSEMIPVSMDSDGIIRGLGIGSDWQWTPVLDSRRHVPGNDGDTQPSTTLSAFHHWPVGVIGSTVLSVLCRVPAGALRVYPPIPRPALTETECVIPAITESTWPTQRFFYANAQPSVDDIGLSESVQHTRGLDLDKHALIQIQAMCKADRLQCALDWAFSLVRQDSLDKAVKIAMHYNKPALGDRIQRISLHHHEMDIEHESNGLDIAPAVESTPLVSSPFSTPVLSHTQSNLSGSTDKNIVKDSRPTHDISGFPPTKRARTFNPFSRRSSSDPFLSEPDFVHGNSNNVTTSVHYPINVPARQSTLSQFVHQKSPHPPTEPCKPGDPESHVPSIDSCAALENIEPLRISGNHVLSGDEFVLSEDL